MTVTRGEAIQYDSFLKEELKQVAVQYNLDGVMGEYLVDNHIILIPDDARKGMIFLGDNSVSYKKGNIKFDLKKALVAGLELVASISEPESAFNYIQLIIVCIFFIEKATKQEISKLEAYTIYLLHIEGVYSPGIEEGLFICEVQKLYEKREGECLEEKKIIEAINHLYEIKVVDFEEGEIYLIETVWLKK